MTITTSTTTILGVTYEDTITDGLLTASKWTDSKGTGEISRTTTDDGQTVETGSWTNDGSAQPQTSYEYTYNSNGTFAGGWKKEKGVTYTYNSDWSIASKTFALMAISDDSYTYGDAAHVVELFSTEANGLTAQTITFQESNSWIDAGNPDNKGAEVSYFDKVATSSGR